MTTPPDWLALFKHAEATGDGRALADVLDDHELSFEARKWMADLLRHRQLKRRQGRPARPLWEPPEPTPRELEVAAAVADIREWAAENKCTFNEALDHIGPRTGIDLETLSNANLGKRRSARRYLPSNKPRGLLDGVPDGADVQVFDDEGR